MCDDQHDAVAGRDPEERDEADRASPTFKHAAARNTPATPPMSASGRFTMTISASAARPNASTSSMKSAGDHQHAQRQEPLPTRSARARTGRRISTAVAARA